MYKAWATSCCLSGVSDKPLIHMVVGTFLVIRIPLCLNAIRRRFGYVTHTSLTARIGSAGCHLSHDMHALIAVDAHQKPPLMIGDGSTSQLYWRPGLRSVDGGATT